MDAATSQPGARKRSPPEDDASNSEGSAASRKRARADRGAAVVDQGEERDEGEISDSKNEGSEKAVVSHNGWNGGVSSGLRTSFPSLKKGMNSKPLRQLTLDTFMKPKPESNDAEPGSKPEVEVQSEPNEDGEAPVKGEFEKLMMPEGYSNNYSKGRRARSWESRFEGWCTKLMSLNKDHDRMQDCTFLKAAWTGWLKQRKHINPLSLTAGLQACERFTLSAEKLEEMLKRALSSEPNSPTDSISTATSTAEPAPNGSENNKMTEQPSTAKKTKPTKNESFISQLAAPSLFSENYVEKLKAGNEKSWEEAFLNWCRDLKDLNPGMIDLSTLRNRNKLGDFYSLWVGNLQGLTKKHASLARRVALEYIERKPLACAELFKPDPPAPISVTISESEEIAIPEPVAMAVEAQEEPLLPVTLSKGELAYRDRYYPGLAPHAVFCVNCSSTEHNSVDCPKMSCNFCSDHHPTWRCPTRVRCTKCNQLGHKKDGCRERLRMTEEEMDCAVCASRDHLEDTCSKLWSGFTSTLVKPHKVQAVPIFCYRCGKEGHYGGDCGIAPPMQKAKKNHEMPTPWTMQNALQYIDITCAEVAIAYKEELQSDKSADGIPDLGKSIVPQQHVRYESDDDDDQEFIQPSVQKKPKVRRGVMHFTGGLSNNSNNQNSRPHGLPARPPAPSYQSGNSMPSQRFQAPEPQNYSPRNRNNAGGGGRFRGGGGGSNRGRGGFSNRH
ncbi:hypothetical protein QBC38DRAFT_357591 [Podospora fimiseda]|uniref:CCHC-type domain-containing protein n=1 Tax=Podospora fimiseda TaxID=252190 RepID=A0AAN7BVE5_9PEZI|nr:hypothetical protein QBC38DRAFT_357591 [Podospora fimiseda]